MNDQNRPIPRIIPLGGVPNERLAELFAQLFGNGQLIPVSAGDIDDIPCNCPVCEYERDQEQRTATAGQLAVAAAPKPVNTDPVVAEFLSSKNNGIVYLGGNSLAFAVEPTRKNFVDVAIAHLGKNEQFVRRVGRRLAIDRLLAGKAITLRLPDEVAGLADRGAVIDFLMATFGEQYTYIN